MRFEFADPHLNGMSIAGTNGDGITYIFRTYYRAQTATPGYFTNFFYSDDDSWFQGGGAGNGYGFHPYPVNASGQTDNTQLENHIHSIADGSDYPANTGTWVNHQVTFLQWYLNVVQIINNGTNAVTYRYYYDYENNPSTYIETTGHNPSEPINPVIAFGDAPHAPGDEVLSGIIRDIRIYNTLLTRSEVDQEISSVGSSGNTPWYYNLDPTPTDISDKSGNGHNPSWIGSERPGLYTTNEPPAPTAPTVSLTATPGTIDTGANSILSWTSTNADSCTASGAWSGAKLTTGSESVSPTSTSIYTLTCSGAGGSAEDSATIQVNLGSGTSEPDMQSDFGGLSAGDDPENWLDTASESSLTEDDAMFKIMNVDGENVFGTDQTDTTNIHSHYVSIGSANWTNYQYTGRMRTSSASDTLGVTIFSDYPNSDSYYRLRREDAGSFNIAPHGTGIECLGTTDTGVTPTPGIWYRFNLQAEDMGDHTSIRAKVWQEGSTEPATWQVNCDDTDTRRTMGTVGIWSVVSGSDVGAKYWDDLRVEPLAAGVPVNAPPMLSFSATPEAISIGDSSTL
ncbi:MAG: hypothetical protein KJO91_11650, partial [Gammaproteobacteria bacterium]|nr:hypothetical protein [Gammaproteobacteria bacterium]